MIESSPTYTGARAGRVGNRRVQQKEAKSVAVAITSRTYSYSLCTHLREGWRSMRAVLIASSSVDCASWSHLLSRRMLVYMRSILVRFLRYRRSGTVWSKRAIDRPPMRLDTHSALRNLETAISHELSGTNLYFFCRSSKETLELDSETSSRKPGVIQIADTL